LIANEGRISRIQIISEEEGRGEEGDSDVKCECALPESKVEENRVARFRIEHCRRDLIDRQPTLVPFALPA
jgi:hypothetical protein